jgi:hypothetical protein
MKYIKLFEEYLVEAGLDLGDLGGDAGGDDKKKDKEVDPEEEIAKAKKEEREKEEKKRNAQIEKAEGKLDTAFKEAPEDFSTKFEKRIREALKKDDRVLYHDIILDIQRWQIPVAKDQDTDKIEKTAPFISILQDLNKSEYR